MTRDVTALCAERSYRGFPWKSDSVGRAGQDAPEPGTKSRVTQTVTQA
jgi:hypothetical protein